MKVIIEIDTGNDAFEPDESGQIAWIIREQVFGAVKATAGLYRPTLSEKMESVLQEGGSHTLFDSNGCICGTVTAE